MSESNLRILAEASAVPRIKDHINRRRFLALSGALGAGAAVLAACGSNSSGGTGSGKSQATGGPVEKDLSVYSWGDYDAPEIVDGFKAKFGTTITIDAFASNDEMLAKLTAAKGTSGYDLLVPSGPFIAQMSQNGLIDKFNKDLLPNLANMDPKILGQEWDPQNEYSVCKVWGTTGYIYDKNVVKTDMKTWKDFLTVATGEASGKTTVFDDPSGICAIYFWANDIDWNTTNEEDLQKAEDYLVGTLAKHITAFDSNPNARIEQGSAALMQIYNGDARQGLLATADPARWQWKLGAPKTEIFMDVWALAAGAPHPEAAHAFLDFNMTPESLLQTTSFLGYNSGGKNIEQRAKDAKLPLMDMIFLTPEQMDTMSSGKVTDALARRVDIWTKMKAAAGA